MSESKLRAQSMDFAVSIINLVKHLKEKRESIISNQIVRSGTSIGANIREAQYAHGKQTLLLRCKSPSKKQTKPDIGWNCCSKQITYTKKSINLLTPPAQVFALCSFLPSTPPRRMWNVKRTIANLRLWMRYTFTLSYPHLHYFWFLFVLFTKFVKICGHFEKLKEKREENRLFCCAKQADFISKLHISLKEAGESVYWLTLLHQLKAGHCHALLGVCFLFTRSIKESYTFVFKKYI